MSTDKNPFRTLERQFERMQQQIEEMFGQWGEVDPFQLGPIGPSSMGIDLADHGDEFVLTADVPGFEKDDIELSITDRTVHIAAEFDEERRTDEESLLRSERQHRALSRSVKLPEAVEDEATEATYKNGVLTVTLPKLESSQIEGQRIDID